MKNRIRVLIADDQQVFRQMLVLTLAEEDDVAVVGQASNGEEAVRLCQELAPDIVLLDIHMPKLNGIEATERIVRLCPATKVVILTAFDEDQFVFQLVRAGATGYLMKDCHSTEIVRAIRAAHSGEALIQPSVTQKILREMSRLMEREKNQTAVMERREELTQLTPKEREVLSLMGRGLNNREIRDVLFVSESTVKTHVNNVMQKMRFRDRVEAVLFAVQAGLHREG